MLTISKEGVAINKRFFQAIEELKKAKRIRGLQTFTKKYNLNYWNVSTLRDNPEKKILKTEMLFYLVTGYNISAHWLLTGEGNMISENAESLSQMNDKNIDKQLIIGLLEDVIKIVRNE